MNRRLGALVRRDPAEIQGAFFVLKGLWPLVRPKSVARRMGPIREPWLMKTMGGLVFALGASLLTAHRRGRVTPELRHLGAWSSLSLLVTDVSMYASGRRSAFYLADAALQAALFVAQYRARSIPLRTIDVRPGNPDPSRYGAGELGRWNIRPGESCDADGKRDVVTEGSMESFPASDPPSYIG